MKTVFYLAVMLMLQSPWAVAADVAVPGYYEFRIYDVTTDKMQGVIERFQETVDPVRKKHGLATLGYWSAPNSTNGGTFVYLMSGENAQELSAREKAFGADSDLKKGYAASTAKHGKTLDRITKIPLQVDSGAKFDFKPAAKPRVFDLRIYSILPGKLEAFRARWRDHGVPVYARHGLHSIGWWVADKKDAAGHDQFICLLAGESLESIQKSISAFHADPEWQRVEKETEAGGKLRSAVTAYKLTPTPFSNLK